MSGRTTAFLMFALTIVVFLPAYSWFGVDLCPLHRLTGLPCPTCGITRATIALLKFNIRVAFSMNPLWVVVVFLIVVSQCIPWIRDKIEEGNWFSRMGVRLALVAGVLINWIYLIIRGD